MAIYKYAKYYHVAILATILLIFYVLEAYRKRNRRKAGRGNGSKIKREEEENKLKNIK